MAEGEDSAQRSSRPGLVLMEKVLLFGYILSTLNPELVDINFFGRDWYRGTTRGIEVGYTDMLAFAMFYFLLKHKDQRPLFWPKNLTAYLLLVFWSIINIAINDPWLFGTYELNKMIRGMFIFYIFSNMVRNLKTIRIIMVALCIAVIYEGYDALGDRYIRGTHRVAGTFDHCNSLAMYMIVGGNAVVILALSAEKLKIRILALVAFGFSGVAILLTISRMALVALALGSMSSIFWSLRKRIGAREIVTILPMAVCGIIAVAMAMDTLMSRMEETDLEAEYAGAENEGRGVYVRLCNLALEDYPMGVGLNNWSYRMTQDYGHRIGLMYHKYKGLDKKPCMEVLPLMDSAQAAPCHNMYLLYWGELGHIGLVLFCIVWFRFLLIAMKSALSGKKDLGTRVASGIFAVTLALSVQGITEWEYRQSPIFFLYHALMGVLIAVDRIHAEQKRRRKLGLPSIDLEDGDPGSGREPAEAARSEGVLEGGADTIGRDATPAPSSPDPPGDSKPVHRKLPFEPITLLVRLGMGLYIPLTLAAVFGVLATRIVKHEPPGFTARSVCIMDAKVQEMSLGYQPATAGTLTGMLTLPSVLEEVSRRVATEDETPEVAGNVEVEEDGKSNIITIIATADTAEAAARIANAVVEVAGERIVLDRYQNAHRAYDYFTQAEKDLAARLENAEKALQELGEVDIAVRASQSGSVLLNIDLELERMKMRAHSVDLRITGLNKIIKDLEVNLDDEVIEMKKAEDLDKARGKIQRIRQIIHRCKAKDVLQPEVEFARKDLKSAERMWERGLISRLELNRKQQSFEVVLQKYEDSPEVAYWREEIDKLDRIVTPGKKNATTRTMPLIREFLLRSMNLKLEKAAIWKEIADMERVRSRAEKVVTDLPDKARRFHALKRQIHVMETVMFEIRTSMAKARATSGITLQPFRVLERAKPSSTTATTSSRKVAIAGMAVLGFFLGFLGLLTWVAVRSRTPSTRCVTWLSAIQLAWKVPRFGRGMPRAGVMKHLLQEQVQFWEKYGGSEGMGGKVILVTGCGEGCGKTLIAESLEQAAICYDARLLHVRFLRDSEWEGAVDLTPVLMGDAAELESRDLLAWRTSYVNLNRVTLGTLSNRVWPRLLERARAENMVVLLDGPDMVPGVTGSLLCRQSDLVFLVIEANNTRPGTIKDSLQRLCGTGDRFFILNSVRWPFAQMF